MQRRFVIMVIGFIASCGVEEAFEQAEAALVVARASRPPEPRRAGGAGSCSVQVGVPVAPPSPAAPASATAPAPEGSPPPLRREDPAADALAYVQAFCEALYRSDAAYHVEHWGVSEARAALYAASNTADCVEGARDDLLAGRLTVNAEAALSCLEFVAEIYPSPASGWPRRAAIQHCGFLQQPKPIALGGRCDPSGLVRCEAGLWCNSWSTPPGCARCERPDVRTYPELVAVQVDKPSPPDTVDSSATLGDAVAADDSAAWLEPQAARRGQEGDTCSDIVTRQGSSSSLSDGCNAWDLVCVNRDEHGVGTCRRIHRRPGEPCRLDIDLVYRIMLLTPPDYPFAVPPSHA